MAAATGDTMRVTSDGDWTTRRTVLTGAGITLAGMEAMAAVVWAGGRPGLAALVAAVGVAAAVIAGGIIATIADPQPDPTPTREGRGAAWWLGTSPQWRTPPMIMLRLLAFVVGVLILILVFG